MMQDLCRDVNLPWLPLLTQFSANLALSKSSETVVGLEE